MSIVDRDRLRQIRTFPSLVKYLRDDLGWPIDSDDFDDLTFDYTPEELGIDAKTAAKIQEIKQLRKLTSSQQWGIFFVKFEPKRLPVVVLRRILSRLVVKKRASANAGERASWQKHDLLFISSFGEGDDRQISFAHFTDNDAHGDLPTLKVLGWDQQDTALKLDHVHDTLSAKLRWPDDEDDEDAWRTQWASAFQLRPREVITTASALAVRLADLARDIRSRVNAALAVESDKGPLTTLMNAFRESLIHDLEPDDFADMYAQTIAYGLLSARVSRPAALVADNLADMVPVTNPFLKELMETFLNIGGRKWSGEKGKLVGIDFDELGVNEVVDTLRDANMEAVLRDFDNRNPQEDPVLHFYEHFLKEYDAKKRMQRGVFYTPKPVVSYIVRSVHELLQTEFGLPLGLADTTTWCEMAERNDGLEVPEGVAPDTPFVQILDPATGTATFLVEVIDLIHRTMMAHWESEGVRGELFLKQKWNAYVPRHLLPRLHGYELMMAPYAIAHMKIGLKLFETGYTFEDDERARVYLTNALDPPQDFSDQFEQMVPALAHEAQAVNDVKRHQRFTVVVGNPPYSVLSANLSEVARSLVDRYRSVDGEPIREKSMLRLEMHLQDDYIKFLRLAEEHVRQSQCGCIGMITNSGYIDTISLRGLRAAFAQTFSCLNVLNLHGSQQQSTARLREAADENVFDIVQGVAVISAASVPNASGCVCIYGELVGPRSTKYDMLARLTSRVAGEDPFVPRPPAYYFFSRDETVEVEFSGGCPINELFSESVTGMVTAHDHLVIDFDDAPLKQVATVLRDSSLADDKAQEMLAVKNNAGWKFAAARLRFCSTPDSQAWYHDIDYRPFDRRRINYHPALVWSDRRNLMRHMFSGKNMALSTCRQISALPWCHVWVGRALVESALVSNKSREICHVFPLWLEQDASRDLLATDRYSNLQADYLSNAMGRSTPPEDQFAYIYGLLHSPSYRARYAEMLQREYPRVLIPSTHDLFDVVARLGNELLALHLLESPRLKSPIARYSGPENPEVEKASYTPENETVWIDRAQSRGFTGVPEDVWNFQIGGYQVCHKWLKDRQAKGGKNPRPGRRLTDEDIGHYCKIVTALHHTIRLMGEIDEVIEEHGGWPGAFVTDSAEDE